MELRTIFTFLRAAELRNFSKAADSLGYAQSTVTMQIQQLEEELGKPLFDRFNRSIALTAFGEPFCRWPAVCTAPPRRCTPSALTPPN